MAVRIGNLFRVIHVLHNRLSVRVCQISTSASKLLHEAMDQSRFDNKAQHKKNRGQRHSSKPVKMSNAINFEVSKLIDKTSFAPDICKIIHSNQENIYYQGVYGKAMKKCNFLRDSESVLQIMRIFLNKNSNAQPTVIEFSIFINSMAEADRPDLCVKYFDIMINEYGIEPNIIVFSALIKSFRRQGMHIEADQCWILMIDKYKLSPNETLYAEMLSVYGTASQKQKAIDLFNEYLRKIEECRLRKDIVVFGAYLHVFSLCGDVKGMEDVEDLMDKHRFRMDKIAMGSFLRGYITARKPKKCIKLLNKWIENGNTPNLSMMSMKCIAFVHLILENESNNSFDDQYKLYLALEDVIYREIVSYKLVVDPLISIAHLDGAIFLYRNNNPMKIVELFEILLNKQLIDYRFTDKKTGKKMIDFRLFQISTVQFVLRYLFGFRAELLLDLCDGASHNLTIITGIGKYTKNKIKHKYMNQTGIKEFVINELLKWDEPIHCNYDKLNDGILHIKSSEIEPYLDNKTNCALKMLKEASDDWHVYKEYNHYSFKM